MRALAVFLVAALLALGLAAVAAMFALAGLPPEDTRWRPLAPPFLAVAPFVGAFLVSVIGWLLLRLRDERRREGAPERLASATVAFGEGRIDDARVLLRASCETLRGERPIATGSHVAAVAALAREVAGDGADEELRSALAALVEQPAPVDPVRLSLLLAFVDAHADAVEGRRAAVERG